MRSGFRRQTEVAVIAATQMGRLIVTRAIRLVPVSHVHLIASAELVMVFVRDPAGPGNGSDFSSAKSNRQPISISANSASLSGSHGSSMDSSFSQSFFSVTRSRPKSVVYVSSTQAPSGVTRLQ